MGTCFVVHLDWLSESRSCFGMMTQSDQEQQFFYHNGGSSPPHVALLRLMTMTSSMTSSTTTLAAAVLARWCRSGEGDSRACLLECLRPPCGCVTGTGLGPGFGDEGQSPGRTTARTILGARCSMLLCCLHLCAPLDGLSNDMLAFVAYMMT